MGDLYPLRFRPLFRRYIWGGRRLETVLGKKIGPGDNYAESWEIVDHGADQSVVTDGPLAGTTLADLISNHGLELLGAHHPQSRFPLLFKFLDAHRDLSVQVHPHDQYAATLDPPDLGKTEAWVVLHAEPGSLIYAGLKRGFDRAAFEREVNRGTCELCLHRFEPQPGDCVFIPAGTVHAIGKGLIVAEIQQASDTTFRIFDWNRVGADGQPRPLHIRQSLEVIDFETGPVDPQTPQPTDREHVEQLVACDKFVLDRWQITKPARLEGANRCHILTVLDGSIQIEGDAADHPLGKGQTMLIPASCGDVAVAPAERVELLDMYLPSSYVR